MASADEHQALEHLRARIDLEAERIAASSWPATEDARVAAAFERAAVAALRAPVLAERSIVLRRVAKRLVPKSLVPLARRAVAVADRASRWAAARIESRSGQ